MVFTLGSVSLESLGRVQGWRLPAAPWSAPDPWPLHSHLCPAPRCGLGPWLWATSFGKPCLLPHVVCRGQALGQRLHRSAAAGKRLGIINRVTTLGLGGMADGVGAEILWCLVVGAKERIYLCWLRKSDKNPQNKGRK